MMFFELVLAGLFLMLVWWLFKSGAVWYLILFGVVLFLLFVFEPPLEEIFNNIIFNLRIVYENIINFFNNNFV